MLVIEYKRGNGAPECIFQNQHKTWYNIFSPDPAVFCVADKQVSHREIYILFSILGVDHFFFNHGCLHMEHMDFIRSIFIRIVFFHSKLSGKHFSDHALQMYRLISPHCLCILP